MRDKSRRYKIVQFVVSLPESLQIQQSRYCQQISPVL
ncbi:hypothetical protein Y788_19980 [Pantoea dispersa 625]|nr:hypothetical protein Y788_19980 [Pantoea dispersa 625]